ncbi:MAG TPA: TolC family protein [Polyangia bacterium]|nr:TolC family protein [Polyangia bacterium]
MLNATRMTLSFRRRRRAVFALSAVALAWRFGAARARAADDAMAGTDATATPSLPAQPLRAMTLAQALAYARAHQPALARAAARVAAAQADTRIARARWLPAVGATAQALEGTANNTTASYLGVPEVALPRIGGTRVDPTGTWEPATSTLVAVGAAQELFDFGRIAAQASVADAVAVAEGERRDADRLRVDLLVREAFLAVESARGVLRSADDAVRRSLVHRDMAAASVKNGLRAPIDLTRAQADVARFTVARIRAAGGLALAQASFAAAVGVDDPALDAVGTFAPPQTEPSLSASLQAAGTHAPDVREARARTQAAEASARAIGAEMRPDLALSAAFSERAGTATASAGSSDKYGPLPVVPNWDVGVVLRWPLYDPVIAARRTAAERRADVARADSDLITRERLADVTRAHGALGVATAVLDGLANVLAAARDNETQANARFRAGLGTSLELADAENTLVDAEIQLVIGRFEALRARAILGTLMGEETP